MQSAESCGLHGVVAERLHIRGHKGANAADKVATIVAGMLTGGGLDRRYGCGAQGGMPAAAR
jgi:hypothetical protein